MRSRESVHARVWMPCRGSARKLAQGTTHTFYVLVEACKRHAAGLTVLWHDGHVEVGLRGPGVVARDTQLQGGGGEAGGRGQQEAAEAPFSWGWTDSKGLGARRGIES